MSSTGAYHLVVKPGGASTTPISTTTPTTYSKIVNKHSGKVLGISNMSTSDGAQALQWSDNGTDDHLWQFVDAGGGYVKIVNKHSGKVLGISNMSTSDGALALQWSDNGTDDHLWQIRS
jgi:hypothetical protein